MILEGKKPVSSQRKFDSKVYQRLENLNDAMPNSR